MTDWLDTPTLKVFGFVSEEGTAMAGTAFCENHLDSKEEALNYAQSQDDADPDFEVIEVSANEMMYCGSCGLNGYSESYA